jgi:hypothetical protein
MRITGLLHIASCPHAAPVMNVVKHLALGTMILCYRARRYTLTLT